jgi:hypothetical protein
MEYRDLNFIRHFYNKRVIQEQDWPVLGRLQTEMLLDSRQSQTVKNTSQGEILRFRSKIPKIKQYSKYSNSSPVATRYKKI